MDNNNRLTNEEAAQKAKEALDAEIKKQQEINKKTEKLLKGVEDGQANDSPKS